MTIFRYVEDKDVFQRFYSKMLAKRLVQANSASDDAEVNYKTRMQCTCMHASYWQRGSSNKLLSSWLLRTGVGRCHFASMKLVAICWQFVGEKNGESIRVNFIMKYPAWPRLGGTSLGATPFLRHCMSLVCLDSTQCHICRGALASRSSARMVALIINNVSWMLLTHSVEQISRAHAQHNASTYDSTMPFSFWIVYLFMC
jgi:hypothetical protein